MAVPLSAADSADVASTVSTSAASTDAATAALSGTAAGADPDGVGVDCSALLDACFADYNRLLFDRAEAEARQAMALKPDLPLPVIFLQAALTAEIQELSVAHRDSGAMRVRFEQATGLALGLETAWEAARHDGRGQLYLGLSLGQRGLVHMYQGRLLAAYRDGRGANAALLLARKRDPGLTEADLGLGEYLYNCGRLSGLLRFFLNLHGDVLGGIALIQLCATGGRRCAPLARLVLAQILTEEVVDFQRALPFVREAEALYPENWSYEKMALDDARGLGLNRPEAQALVESVAAQWDKGWRPPAYARVDPGPMRLALAKIYLSEGQKAAALRHLTVLEKGGGPEAAQARRLLADLAHGV